MFSIPSLRNFIFVGQQSQPSFSGFGNFIGTNRIDSSALDGENLYVSGNFSQIIDKSILRSGNAAFLNKNDASFSSAVKQSSFNYDVNCVVSDGSYLYVGGYFTEYNGTQVNYLAKINASTGVLDQSFNAKFTPNSWPWIASLALDGDNLYVGGEIYEYDGKTRNALIKINKNTGNEVDADETGFSVQDPFGGYCYLMSMAVDGGGLYIGGYFQSYGGSSTPCLVKIDKTTGILDSTFVAPSFIDSDVQTILIDGDDLYAGGNFYSGFVISYITKINKNTGVLDTAFHQDFIGFDEAPTAMACDSSGLYVVGSFRNHISNLVGNTSSLSIAKINKIDGALDTNFNLGTSVQDPSNPMATQNVYAVKLDGDNLYIGGNIRFYKGKPRGPVIKINKNTAEEVDADGTGFSKEQILSNLYYECHAIQILGNSIYVVGYFPYFSTDADAVFNQRGMAKISTLTGKVDKNFTPDIVNITKGSWYQYPIKNILTDIDYVYFHLTDLMNYYGQSGNGEYLNRIYKLNKNTGSLVNDDISNFVFNRPIRQITQHEDSLYACGDFDDILDESLVKYKNAVLIDKDSAVLPSSVDYQSLLKGEIFNTVADGDYVYVCGRLISYNNTPVGNVIKINILTGDLDSAFVIKDFEYVDLAAAIGGLALDGDNLYVVGGFVKYDGKDRKFIIKINKNTGNEVDVDGTGFSDPVKTQDLIWQTYIYGYGQTHRVAVDGQFLYIRFIGSDIIPYNGISVASFFRVDKNTAELDQTFSSNSSTPGISSINGSSFISKILIDQDSIYLSSPSNSLSYNLSLTKFNKSTGEPVLLSDPFFSQSFLWPDQSCSMDADDDFIYLIGTKSNQYYSVPYFFNIETSTSEFETSSQWRFCKINKNNGNVENYNLLDGIKKKDNLAYQTYSNIDNIKIDGNNIYLSGKFDTIYQAETIKSHKAVLLDKANSSMVGTVNKSFFNGDVLCSVVDGDYVYVGGSFNRYNNVIVNGVVRIHIPTGELDTSFSFNNSLLQLQYNTITALAVDSDRLYYAVYGSGYQIYAIDKYTGSSVALSFSQVNSYYGLGVVMDMFVDSSYVYVCGSFTDVGAIESRGICRLNKTNGAVDSDFANQIGSGAYNAPGAGIGYISSMVFDDDYIYIGGKFDFFRGVDWGNIVKLNRNIGNAETSLFSAMQNVSGSQYNVGFKNGKITSIVIDGDDLYIGGRFATYCSYNSNVKNIAKINKNTAVLDVNFIKTEGVDDLVTALAIDGNDLYIGGKFNNYIAQYGPRSRNAALINKTDASLVETVIESSFNGDVRCTVAAGDYIYVAGDFTSYNNTAVDRLAKIHIPTGQLDLTFSLQNPMYQFGQIKSIAIDGNDLYIAGYLIYNSPITSLIKVNKDTGVLDASFAPSIDCNNSGIQKIIVGNTHVYAVGSFTECNSILRERIVKLDKTSGSVDMDFDTSVGFDNVPNDIAIEGDYLYIGGDFASYKNIETISLTKIHKDTALTDPSFSSSNTKLTMQGFYANGQNPAIKSIALDDNYVYVLGEHVYKVDDNLLLNKSRSLALINSTDASISNLAAWSFSKEDGSRGTVQNSIVDGDYIYLTVDNSTKFYNKIVAINSLVKIHILTGLLDTSFNPGTGISGNVNCIAINGDDLYIGGLFTDYNGSAVQNLIKINKNTASLDLNFDTSSGFNGGVNSIAVDDNDSYVYVCGDFTQYKGVDAKRLAKVSKTTAALDLNFDTSVGLNSWTYYLKLDWDDLYIGGEFTSYKGDSVSSLIKVNRHTSALDTQFTFQSDAGVWRFDLDNSSIFVSGWQSVSPYSNFVIKINKTNGSQDSSFVFKNKRSEFADQLILNGSSLYVDYSGKTYGEHSVGRVIKVDKNTGNLDLLFDTSNKFAIIDSASENYQVLGISITAYGLFVFGSFDYYELSSSIKTGNLIRFNKTSGEFDSSFNPLHNGYDFNYYSGSKQLLIDLDYIYAATGGSVIRDSYSDPKGIIKINRITKEIETSTFDTFSSAFDNGNMNAEVYCLANTDYGIYAGGRFYKYKNDGDVSANKLIKLNKNTAQVDANFDTSNAFDNLITNIVPTSHGLHVSGFFNSLNNESVYKAVNLVKINKDTKLINLIFDTTNVKHTNGIGNMTISSGGLYITGSFENFTDLVYFNRSGIAKINKNTGILDSSLNINLDYLSFGAGVHAMLIEDNDIYITGDWNFINQKNRPRVAKINKINGKLNLDFRYRKNSSYQETETEIVGSSAKKIISDGNSIWICGNENGNVTSSGYNVIKLQKNNGSIDYSVTASGQEYNGASKLLVRPNGSVQNIFIDGEYYYLTGYFTEYYKELNPPYAYAVRNKIVKVAKNGYLMEAFDAGSGYNPNIAYENITFDNEYMYITGDFNSYNGNDSKYMLVKVNKITGSDL
jgi:hypothetical protein